MSTAAARVAACEAAITRLTESRGPRVSTLLREARARATAGVAMPIFHDVATVAAEARLPGLRGQMARARLRVLEGVPQEAPLPVRVEPQDGHGEVGGKGETPASIATRSAGFPGTLAGTSEVVRRIDQLLAQAGARS